MSTIITHKVLNDASGELEAKDFQLVKQTSNLRGGFRMVYSTYDEAVASIITSKVDFIILVHIRDLFTYMQTEVSISSADIAKLFGVSKPKVTRLISAMLEHNLLYRVSKGIYRLNPFMFLPYKSNGATLQADWKTLTSK
jgi:hypothetical protein